MSGPILWMERQKLLAMSDDCDWCVHIICMSLAHFALTRVQTQSSVHAGQTSLWKVPYPTFDDHIRRSIYLQLSRTYVSVSISPCFPSVDALCSWLYCIFLSEFPPRRHPPSVTVLDLHC